MSQFRILERKKDNSFEVQEQRACGDYDGWEWRWCTCSRVYKKVFNFLGIKIKYNRYPKAIFNKIEEAEKFLEKLIYKDSLIPKDKVIMEV